MKLISKSDVHDKTTCSFTYQVDKKDENNETKLSAILMQNSSTDVNEFCLFLCHFSITSFMMRPHAISDKPPPNLGMMALATSNVDQSPMSSLYYYCTTATALLLYQSPCYSAFMSLKRYRKST